jgi:hypothetical protein
LNHFACLIAGRLTLFDGWFLDLVVGFFILGGFFDLVIGDLKLVVGYLSFSFLA